ncbi:uncharacterized protein MONOS_9318 [Monocercomonoides exilis]|uniref:uncharacterized protein n=1 Tax=Monocercomonoides exilis TaxID=2049356 RepID=UPI00355A8B15|nr:hypothetical protein MONOS_9318 [Monocercomonoides exilis]|eukprot:MONOS_9318.1-p1 / transcript=MONOS_9318.1 / gene=MONOS_9318 / organism=Monocercomonoides_exilis_PA203 / gene_product=unspecified product / transcript_product=unspecified product / location=Mono_scaffold00380:40700-41100(-) / protein_length=92 / sequence_SO=supercontig / SO=protein_coding / is_pseudo=false
MWRQELSRSGWGQSCVDGDGGAEAGVWGLCVHVAVGEARGAEADGGEKELPDGIVLPVLQHEAAKRKEAMKALYNAICSVNPSTSSSSSSS